jgi:hypothetical protein
LFIRAGFVEEDWAIVRLVRAVDNVRPYKVAEGPIRTAYVLNMSSLPKLADGMVWDVVPTFRAGDELLDNPGLKDVFRMALEKGCAIVTPKAKK